MLLKEVISNYLILELMLTDILIIKNHSLITISEWFFIHSEYDYDYMFKIKPPLSAFLRFSPSIFALKFLMYL